MKGYENLLEMDNIRKSFPGVQALNGVDLVVRPGEVHAILGENGAGKSTLMKILSGAYRMDSGEIRLKGKPVDILNPTHAQRLGIAMIYQEFTLAPHLSIAANVFIGREPFRSPLRFIRNREMEMETSRILGQLDVELDPRRKVKSLNVCQQQITEIAKALSIEADIFIMDEPTSALMESEVETLFRVIRRLKDDGIGIVYISHNLEEVFAISDTITVLRDGRHIASKPAGEITPGDAVRMMIGRDISEMYPERRAVKGECVLNVNGLSSGTGLRDVSFSLHKGEILGITGLLGAGRTELARALFGVDPVSGGRVTIGGNPAHLRSIPEAMAAGMGFVPEDRKHQGLFLDKSVMWNISSTNIPSISRRGMINRKRERSFARKYTDTLDVRVSGLNQKVVNLSGGNQQKVVLAKWLARNPRVLILDDPTRGIDVGAKQSIYRLMVDLAATGMGIIFISSELPEILGISDRILVMGSGTILGELSREEANQESVMGLLTCDKGGKKE